MSSGWYCRKTKSVRVSKDDIQELVDSGEFVAIVDDLKHGKKFMGYSIEDPSQLESKQFDKILITAINSRELLIEKLSNKLILLDKIVQIH